MTIFQYSLSCFTLLSHSELVYIHFSLCTPPCLSSLYLCQFCWTIKSPSLFSSVYWESMFGQRCCSLPSQWFSASGTSSWDQTRTAPGSLDFTAPIKDKWECFNLVVNLTFRAKRIIIHENKNKKPWKAHKDETCYLDSYLGLHAALQWHEWRKSPKEENNRSVSKETDASSQAVDLEGFFWELGKIKAIEQFLDKL